MNENKYLPIGTVCSIITSQRNVMIIGYKPVVFEKNELKTYDYKAVYYPEGSLGVNSEAYFNHISITKVLYNGYRDGSYISLNKAIGGGVENKNTVSVPQPPTEESLKKNTGFKFDANGFVIEEEEIDNPFVTNIEETTTSEPQNNNWDIFKSDDDASAPVAQTAQAGGYKFDANGNVVDDAEAPAPVAQTAPTGGYKFDANGNVVDDAEAPAPVAQTTPAGGYKFDENGNVVDDAEAPAPVAQTTPTGGYKFDENGNVIDDAEAPVPTTQNVSAQNNEVGAVAPSYKYDENGVVISE